MARPSAPGEARWRGLPRLPRRVASFLPEARVATGQSRDDGLRHAHHCTVPRVAVDRPDLPRARRAGGRLGTPGSASLGGAAERHAPRAAPPRRGHPMAVRSYSDSSAPTSRRCLISAWVAPDAQRAIGSFEHGTSLVARLPHVNLFSRVVGAMRLRHGRAETPLQGRRRAECPMRSRAAGDRMGSTAGASPITRN